MKTLTQALVISIIVMLILIAGITIGESIPMIRAIDLPEEMPELKKGDTLCFFQRRDTLFIEYYHNSPSQQDLHKYIFNH